MKSPTLFFSLLILVLLLYFLVEIIIQRFTLSKFRNRIHVNGTRGKSSVTRLIRAGLSAGGERVFAKTTGTLARMIYPDGTEQNINRWGKPSILEQISILRKAKKARASSIVIECMALEPRYQWASEGLILKSHIGVITNIREDHLDIMGPSLRNVTQALASAIPVGGKLFVGSLPYPDIIENACRDRQTYLTTITPEDVEKVTQEEMDRFSYWEHKSNVAIALHVCGALGVGRQIALDGMWKAEPDPGALVPLSIHFFAKDIIYLNAMAANDSESTRMIWQACISRYEQERVPLVLFNCREDRLDRSRLMAEEIATWQNVPAIFLIGTGTKYALHFLKKECREGTKIFNWEDTSLDHLFESILSQTKSKSVLLGVGNIAGIGLELNQYLKNRAKSYK